MRWWHETSIKIKYTIFGVMGFFLTLICIEPIFSIGGVKEAD